MTDELLPALPEPSLMTHLGNAGFTDDQMHAYASEAIRQHAASDTAASKAARVLCDRFADDCNVDRDGAWMIYGGDYLDDARAALEAAFTEQVLKAASPPAGEVALPGGGVDGLARDAARYREIARRFQHQKTSESELFLMTLRIEGDPTKLLDEIIDTALPTPNPHEADRNG